VCPLTWHSPRLCLTFQNDIKSFLRRPPVLSLQPFSLWVWMKLPEWSPLPFCPPFLFLPSRYINFCEIHLDQPVCYSHVSFTSPTGGGPKSGSFKSRADSSGGQSFSLPPSFTQPVPTLWFEKNPPRKPHSKNKPRKLVDQPSTTGDLGAALFFLASEPWYTRKKPFLFWSPFYTTLAPWSLWSLPSHNFFWVDETIPRSPTRFSRLWRVDLALFFSVFFFSFGLEKRLPILWFPPPLIRHWLIRLKRSLNYHKQHQARESSPFMGSGFFFFYVLRFKHPLQDTPFYYFRLPYRDLPSLVFF